MKLSIIIPVYNEEKTVSLLLEKVTKVKLTGVEKEIIVVDDGSTDTTAAKISKFISSKSKVKYISHKKNAGKGEAVRTGLKHATGEYIIIQDADLEYDPKYIEHLITPLKQGVASVVYGTRLKRLPNLSRDERTPRLLLHYFGNKLLSLLTSMLYFQWVTDMETCYKLFPKKGLEGVTLRSKGFELEPEITAKLFKKGYTIYEVPISTIPRDYNEGKKLRTFDAGFKALWALIKYRFID